RSLVPDGWDRYRPDNYDRDRGYDRNDRGRHDYSNYDENLPPEWRNGRWRESREDNRRDSRYDDRRNYRVPGDRRGNDARIVPYRYGDDRILSEPTITVQKIEEVLRQYNSPAQGLGQLIFDLGVQYKINPAMALAFFVKESSAGTKGWAVKTNNWGNRKGTGPAGRAGPFMKYHSFEDSVKDWFPYIIRRYVNQGLDTLPTLIHTYAPNNDGNNEAGYVRAVMNMMRKWSV
ncbi:MAG: glucosaminidase domain-containing protein, partial [Cyanobacteria bacterium HKST-UBA01]|nr:glucosaminidase domain-containing protein [Cyanobacteria bacterium HKST-UBA01]